jgi:hypothetical protein
MIMSRYQTAGQNYNLMTADKSFENVVQFKYLGTSETNQNYIHEKVKNRLTSVQNLLSSHLLSNID